MSVVHAETKGLGIPRGPRGANPTCEKRSHSWSGLSRLPYICAYSVQLWWSSAPPRTKRERGFCLQSVGTRGGNETRNLARGSVSIDLLILWERILCFSQQENVGARFAAYEKQLCFLMEALEQTVFGPMRSGTAKTCGWTCGQTRLYPLQLLVKNFVSPRCAPLFLLSKVLCSSSDIFLIFLSFIFYHLLSSSLILTYQYCNYMICGACVLHSFQTSPSLFKWFDIVDSATSDSCWEGLGTDSWLLPRLPPRWPLKICKYV